MDATGSWSIYTDDRQQWRQEQREEDKKRQKFFQDVDRFPNLFNLKPLFRHRRRAQHLLEKQKDELTFGWFQYQMEIDRCKNFIVFLLYLVDRKMEALDYCEQLKPTSDSDIIRLTNLAVLQWEMGQRWKAEETIEKLKELQASSSFSYLRAVAVAEQGHVFTHFGPKYFLQAIDLLREAVISCPDRDVYLWKYDLAIAIRRNFNLFVYSEHSRSSPTDLAEEAWELLNDVSTRCPNRYYKVRGFTELARLVTITRSFGSVCKDNEKERLTKLCSIKYMHFIHKALITAEGQNDHFVMRESGRHFMYINKRILARKYLSKSLEKKKDCITYQLLGKLSLKEYREQCWNKGRHSSPDTCTTVCDSDQVPYSTGHHPQATNIEKVAVSHHRSQSPGLVALRRTGSEEMACASVDNLSGSRLQTESTEGAHAVSAETYSLPAEFESKMLIGDPGTQEDTSIGQDSQQVSVPSCPPYKAPVSKSYRIRTLLKSFTIAADRYDEYNEHVQAAEVYFRNALQLNPSNAGVLLDAGHMYQGMNKPDKALEHFKRILSINEDERPTHRVNAYEQSGICLLALSEQPGLTPEQKSTIISSAEDMFMSSLRECKNAVRGMHGVSAQRTQVWDSYPKLIQILENASDDKRVTSLQKMAHVHEEVGMYLKAIKAYQGILGLSEEPRKRKEALLGLMRNHCSSDDVTQARAILDVCVDEGHLTKPSDDDADDDELFSQLRDTAVDVYRLCASHALREGLVGDACLCFQSALTLTSLIEGAAGSSSDEPSFRGDGNDHEEHVMRKYDVCIFDDAGNIARLSSEEGADTVSKASAALATVMETVFGMSVSRNDEGTIPGRLSFEGELHLAETATTVVLVLGPGNKLSPRMAFLADTALRRTHEHADRVFPIIISDSQKCAPKPLDRHLVFSNPMDLLELGADCDNGKFMGTLPSHRDFLLQIFNYILSPVYTCA